jgi:hypothetical protein
MALAEFRAESDGLSDCDSDRPRDRRILGSLGEFETCPDWVPTLDKRWRCARIVLKTIGVYGFDQRIN